MLEDLRRGNEEEARRQREAAEKAARDRAQASLAQLSMQSQGSQGSQGSWQPQQPQNYPPAPSWQQVSRLSWSAAQCSCRLSNLTVKGGRELSWSWISIHKTDELEWFWLCISPQVAIIV